jgi:hypothetical protein
MTNNSLDRSIIEFKIAIIKVLYKNKKISNNEYNNALKIYEKKLDVYINNKESNEKNIVIDLRV